MLRSALPGERFGRLVVTEAVNARLRRCRCDCGVETTVERANLKSGNTQSCGCLRRELIALVPLTHGATRGGKRNSTHSVWHNMLQRCLNPNNSAWHHYGGRGIAVCPEWAGSFAAFLADMGERPWGHSLNRVDNDGPYSPTNCVWSIPTDQARNKRNNRFLTFRGKNQPLAAWAEECGIPYYTLHARLRRGWSVERTLTTGVRNVV